MWLDRNHQSRCSLPSAASCPSIAMASLSEEVLLVLKKVRQRKQDGTLYLMAERIAWGPEGKDRFSVSHLYSDIRCECIFASFQLMQCSVSAVCCRCVLLFMLYVIFVVDRSEDQSGRQGQNPAPACASHRGELHFPFLQRQQRPEGQGGSQGPSPTATAEI